MPKKKTPKKKVAKKKAAAKAPREKVHPDMLTVSMRGANAKPILAFMKKHKLKGAVLFRAAFELYKEEVEAGNINPNAEEEEEEE